MTGNDSGSGCDSEPCAVTLRLASYPKLLPASQIRSQYANICSILSSINGKCLAVAVYDDGTRATRRGGADGPLLARTIHPLVAQFGPDAGHPVRAATPLVDEANPLTEGMVGV